MTTLAIDFSSSHRSVAVIRQPQAGSPTVQSEVVEVGGRSTKAFHMVEAVLSDAQIERVAIDTIAIGLGPGSYTGIRASLAIAQGWQLARQVRLVGIGSVEVLAAQAHHNGVRGLLHTVVDAQRGEFYHAAWDLGQHAWRETQPLRIVPRTVIEGLLAGPGIVGGPDLRTAFPAAIGLFPSALFVGRLALGRTSFVKGEELRPVYLRETTFVKAAPPARHSR